MARRTSFIVRVVEQAPGYVNGVIELVATGAKEVFSGTDLIGPTIQRMLRREAFSRPTARPSRPGKRDADPKPRQ
jgi:hypothetical protein